jgi:hypothetical protein
VARSLTPKSFGTWRSKKPSNRRTSLTTSEGFPESDLFCAGAVCSLCAQPPHRDP